jgi:hypothetical protein
MSQGGEQVFEIEILPKNASHMELWWSKGMLVYPSSVDFRWEPDEGTNTGKLYVTMTSQYREKKDQLPREANKLDMMVWAENCTVGMDKITSQAPQNFSREEGVLFVTGRNQTSWKNLATVYQTSYPNLEFPLNVNPPSLDDWNTYFKNKIDKDNSAHKTPGRPYSQPKVKIKIKQ